MTTEVARISGAAVAVATTAVAAVAALWVASGVSSTEAALYLLYMALAVALPGIVVVRAAYRDNPGGLALVCLGMPVGMALQIVGFVLVASLGFDRLAWFVAPAVGVAAGLVLVRRRGLAVLRVRFVRGPVLEWVLIGAIGVSSVALMALRDFPQHPLPRQVSDAGLAYYRDMPWHLGNLSAVKRGWPLENPRIAGEPLHYHVGAYVFGGGTSTVTGIDVATLLFRLDPVMVLLLLGAQVVWAGRQCGGGGLVGVVAAYLILLTGDAASLWRQTSSQFFNLFLTHFYLSPTFSLGLVLFLPALVLAGKIIAGDRPRQRGDVMLGLLLLPACGLAKSTTLPVLAAAAVGVGALHLLRRREFHRSALVVAAVVAVVFVVVWPVVIPPSADEVKTMTWNPLGTFRLTPMWKALRSDVSTGAMTLIVALGHAPAMLAGIVAYVVARRRLTPMHTWLAMVALAGAGPALLFTATGNGQLYFWFNGYVAAAVLAAVGLAGCVRPPRSVVARGMRIAAAVAVVIATLSVVFQSRPGVKRLMGDRFRVFQANPDNQVPDRPADLTRGMVEGLRWVEQHTDPAVVIAVNDQTVNFYYSALTERAVYLEKFAGVVDVITRTPVTERERAVGRLFGDAGPDESCAAAARTGVSYLVNIKHAGSSSLRLPESNRHRMVFDNPDMSVLSLAGCDGGANRTFGVQ